MKRGAFAHIAYRTFVLNLPASFPPVKPALTPVTGHLRLPLGGKVPSLPRATSKGEVEGHPPPSLTQPENPVAGATGLGVRITEFKVTPTLTPLTRQ